MSDNFLYLDRANFDDVIDGLQMALDFPEVRDHREAIDAAISKLRESVFTYEPDEH